MVVSSITIIKSIIENGFQLEPDAFDLIKNLRNDSDVNNIIKDIMNIKIRDNKKKSITKLDLISVLLPKNEQKIKLTQLKIDSRIEVVKNNGFNFKPLEGIKGFEKLFKSRYDKLLEITYSRPNFHNIKKI